MSREFDEVYEMACIFKHETENATLIVDPASGEEIWIPLSQVASMHKNDKGEGTIVMSAWIAHKKGLK